MSREAVPVDPGLLRVLKVGVSESPDVALNAGDAGGVPLKNPEQLRVVRVGVISKVGLVRVLHLIAGRSGTNLSRLCVAVRLAQKDSKDTEPGDQDCPDRANECDQRLRAIGHRWEHETVSTSQYGQLWVASIAMPLSGFQEVG